MSSQSEPHRDGCCAARAWPYGSWKQYHLRVGDTSMRHEVQLDSEFDLSVAGRFELDVVDAAAGHGQLWVGRCASE